MDYMTKSFSTVLRIFATTAFLVMITTWAQANEDPNFKPIKKDVQRVPQSNLKELIGTLKHGPDNWKAYTEMVAQSETHLIVEINGEPSLKYRELDAFFDRGRLVRISHPVYKNPVLITVWERGVGSKVLRIFYPTETTEPVFVVETPDEGLNFRIRKDRIQIRYTDPNSLTPGFSDKPPKQILVEWPPKAK
ncbi:MAG: hypothetical protein KDD43_09420 [Bdellovibrionales bacterium]|nr:hypothetical protein [Bdellovibrionales bacterium]